MSHSAVTFFTLLLVTVYKKKLR